jgi:hypothetical protein
MSRQVTGGNWVELPAGAWQHTKRRVSSCQARARGRSCCAASACASLVHHMLTGCCFCAPSHRHSPLTPCCQVEVDIMFNRLLSHPPEGRHSGMAKFRILSVDIECAGRKVRQRVGCRYAPAAHAPLLQH